MSYIPPHKRHSKGGGASSTTPIPESLPSQFNRGLNLKYFSDKKQKKRENDWNINKWFPVGLTTCNDSDSDSTRFVRLTRLEPFSLESYERKSGEKPLTLILNRDRLKECGEGRRVFLENPWSFIAENMKQDLISAVQSVQNEMDENKFQIVKTGMVARMGYVLFHRVPSAVQSSENISLPESTVKQLRRSFYTTVSPSYMEYIINEGVKKMGFDFEEEKDIFYVKLADNMQPSSIISCKCTLPNDSKMLKLFKIELNPVRHLVADMSCLDRDLDLRLMLCTKKIMMNLSDDEMRCVNDLIGSAVLDPEVKGGLRWPLGKECGGDRFTVVGVWHTSAKSFRNSSIRVKVRLADRFDFRTSSGEVAREVSVKMPGIVSELQVQPINDQLLLQMLERNLKLIWDIFLCSASLS